MATMEKIRELKRLPGAPQPREELLAEVQEHNRKAKERLDPVLWSLMLPDPDKLYRWRVRLSCGCVQDALTSGEDRLPLGPWTSGAGYRLPQGQRICVEHSDDAPSPYRRVRDWGTAPFDRREHEFPADPEEPPDYWPDENAEAWLSRRHTEPYKKAFWTVTLECGHRTEICTDLDWSPKDGPRLTSKKRQQEMLTEWDKYAGELGEERTPLHEHMRRMIVEGFPMPHTEQSCYTCLIAKQIDAYQRVGWLVPRKSVPKPPGPPDKATLERRLQAAERARSKADADIERLQRELGDT